MINLEMVLLTSAIGMCSIVGDKCVMVGNTAVMRAFFDNVTHAVVGGLTWAIVVLLSRKPLIHYLQSIFSSLLLSSFIDIDHFISARSWKLYDATNLEKRPFLHCTTVPILIWVTLMILSKLNNNERLNYYSWIICASFLSHHIRDGTRKGLWLYPFGTTPPIPYYMYICLDMALPYIIYWFMILPVFASKTNDIQKIHELV